MAIRRIPDQLLSDWAVLYSAAHVGAKHIKLLHKKIRQGESIAEWQKSDGSWTTQADILAQEAIVREFKKYCPDDIIIAEEDKEEPSRQANRPHTFIDPLDGTSNFRRGETEVTISIGRFNGENSSGIIMKPFHGDYYLGGIYEGQKFAARFRGGETPISVSPFLLDKPRVVISGQGKYQRIIDSLRKIGCATKRSKTATFNCLMVAEGSVDAYIAPGGFGRNGVSHRNMKWDIAAGEVIIRGAGGIATQISGEPLNLEHTSFLAANKPELHKQITEALAQFGPENNFGLNLV